MHRGGCQTIEHGGRWVLALGLWTGAHGLKKPVQWILYPWLRVGCITLEFQAQFSVMKSGTLRERYNINRRAKPDFYAQKDEK